VARLHADIAGGELVAGPAGHAITTAPLARAAGAAPDHVRPLAIDGLVAVRGLAVGGGAAATRAALSPAGGYGRWLQALGWLRLGWSHRLLDAAVAHLSQRRSAGAPLLGKQVVQERLAEVACEQLIVASALPGGDTGGGTGGATSRPVLAQLHAALTTADRRLIALFGAYGYTSDGPGSLQYLSELIADVYIGSLGGTEPEGG
jgi:hypothetical protein